MHFIGAIKLIIKYSETCAAFHRCLRCSLNGMPYLLFLKKQQNLKLSSAANYGLIFACLVFFLSEILYQELKPQKTLETL